MPHPAREKAESMVGSVLDGRYRLDELIGLGGMGAVYRAQHQRTQRWVAVKVLLSEWTGSSSVFVARFEREARAAGFLKHDHIVDTLTLGRVPDGPLYLVMELIEGLSVGDLVEAGAVEPRRALRIAGQALEALDFAHQHGFIHRDLKPENLMLIGRPPNEQVKVLDFGLVKLIGMAAAELGDETLTATGMVCGTPVYMAPEQALTRPVDARTDVYSLGLILFEMLSGKPVFWSNDPMALMRMHVGAARPTLAERGVAPAVATPALEALVARATAIDPDQRYASAADMNAAIAALSP